MNSYNNKNHNNNNKNHNNNDIINNHNKTNSTRLGFDLIVINLVYHTMLVGPNSNLMAPPVHKKGRSSPSKTKSNV